MAVVIHELNRRSEEFEVAVVHTGQHRTMLDHVLHYFKIKPDFDLDVMRLGVGGRFRRFSKKLGGQNQQKCRCRCCPDARYRHGATPAG